MRRKAIEALGAMGALPALRQLWATEKDPALRDKLLEAFGIAGDIDTLVEGRAGLRSPAPPQGDRGARHLRRPRADRALHDSTASSPSPTTSARSSRPS